MIFLTVGTQFPFDRFVRAVDSAFDEGLVTGTIFAQIGESSYRPRNFESAAHLEKGTFDNYLREASGVSPASYSAATLLTHEGPRQGIVVRRLRSPDGPVTECPDYFGGST